MALNGLSAAMSSSAVSQLDKSTESLVFLRSGRQVRRLQFSTINEKVFRKGAAYSPLTVRSWKGHVAPPPELTEHFNGGVIPAVKPAKPMFVKRKDFPADFRFGCSTSALQTEVSGTEGGRGPSTWDGFIQDGVAGLDIAVDSYHRYKSKWHQHRP